MARAQYLEDTCKTALNRVPAESRVPFRWTINPYRGCSHSCVYCFARGTHRVYATQHCESGMDGSPILVTRHADLRVT